MHKSQQIPKVSPGEHNRRREISTFLHDDTRNDFIGHGLMMHLTYNIGANFEAISCILSGAFIPRIYIYERILAQALYL